MDRFQAQLMALEHFYVDEENNTNKIDKIEVTKIEWNDLEDDWNIQYTVTYQDGKIFDGHELIGYYEK